MKVLSILLITLFLTSCHHIVIKDSNPLSTIDLNLIKSNLKLDSIRLLGSLSRGNKRIDIVYGDRSLPTYKDQGLFLYPSGPVPHPDSLRSLIFSLPGDQFNMLDSLVYQCRVFYGSCTSKFPFSIIWHQREKLENGSWRLGYYVIDLESQDYFSLRLNEGDISLNEILDNIKQGKCKEIPGLIIHLEP